MFLCLFHLIKESNIFPNTKIYERTVNYFKGYTSNFLKATEEHLCPDCLEKAMFFCYLVHGKVRGWELRRGRVGVQRLSWLLQGQSPLNMENSVFLFNVLSSVAFLESLTAQPVLLRNPLSFKILSLF